MNSVSVLAGEWTPRRVLHLARAEEINALCAVLNALPEALDDIERALREIFTSSSDEDEAFDNATRSLDALREAMG